MERARFFLAVSTALFGMLGFVEHAQHHMDLAKMLFIATGVTMVGAVGTTYLINRR